jgi:hypothetical protein
MPVTVSLLMNMILHIDYYIVTIGNDIFKAILDFNFLIVGLLIEIH